MPYSRYVVAVSTRSSLTPFSALAVPKHELCRPSYPRLGLAPTASTLALTLANHVQNDSKNDTFLHSSNPYTRDEIYHPVDQFGSLSSTSPSSSFLRTPCNPTANVPGSPSCTNGSAFSDGIARDWSTRMVARKRPMDAAV